MLNHIKTVLAKGKEERYDYILNWFAYLLQKGKNETAPVFFGERGAGKSSIAEFFVKWVIGAEYAMIESDLAKIFGRFNSVRDNKVLIT